MLKWFIWLVTGANCDYPPKPVIEAPLELTSEMVVRAKVEHWKRANKIFDHINGCRCSTCELVAGMAAQMDAKKEHQS